MLLMVTPDYHQQAVLCPHTAHFQDSHPASRTLHLVTVQCELRCELRESIKHMVISVFTRAIWTITRCEAPVLTKRSHIEASNRVTVHAYSEQPPPNESIRSAISCAVVCFLLLATALYCILHCFDLMGYVDSPAPERDDEGELTTAAVGFPHLAIPLASSLPWSVVPSRALRMLRKSSVTECSSISASTPITSISTTVRTLRKKNYDWAAMPTPSFYVCNTQVHSAACPTQCASHTTPSRSPSNPIPTCSSADSSSPA